MKYFLFIILCLTPIGVYSQVRKRIDVFPVVMKDVINSKQHLAITIKVVNRTNERYIFRGASHFNKYLTILKRGKNGKWLKIVHPSIIELEERAINDGLPPPNYAKYYDTETPLFRKWALNKSSDQRDSLDKIQEKLIRDIINSPLVETIKNCDFLPLFFIDRKYNYTNSFWNMDFMLEKRVSTV